MDQFRLWTDRLRASDRKAYSELFEAMHPRLLRYAAQITNDGDGAYDVVQDAFIKVWQMRDRLDPERSLKSLLYTMVRNLSLNALRQVQTEQQAMAVLPPSESAIEETAAERIDTEALKERIREWIAELPPRRREAFSLSRFDGLSHDEIAEIMQLAPRTVTNHIMLALQHLRDRLRACEVGT